jgi:16S rRNA (cytosine1402-N4)-methyltransferase
MAHIPVLLQEAIVGLDIQDRDIYLDATSGGGGHMEEVFKRFGNRVTILGIDADPTAIEVVDARMNVLGAKPKLAVLNFRHIDRLQEIFDIKGVDKILFDLGWNAMQFDTEEGKEGRGFSFSKEEPLLMTFGTPREEDTTAYTVVNEWQEDSLRDVIYGYGEERFAKSIAKKIVESRKNGPIKTAIELANLIKDAVPVWYRFSKLHPATRTFQAIRIAVNDELRALEEGLKKSFEILNKDGRMAVISFHSLEDRIVKLFFRFLKEEGKVEILTKKPEIATDTEIKSNPRSRSAKLRIIKKII